MRRGWVGLAGVLGVLLGACEDPAPPGDGAEKGISEGEFVEDTLQAGAVTTLLCPAISAVRARADTFVVLADSSRVVHLEGGGRDHSLWIWAAAEPTRTVVVSEMTGSTNGVEIDVTLDPASPAEPWAMLTLDAGDCRGGPPPFIVRQVEGSVFTRPDGGFDDATSTAFAVLRGNSGYMLATPTKGMQEP